MRGDNGTYWNGRGEGEDPSQEVATRGDTEYRGERSGGSDEEPTTDPDPVFPGEESTRSRTGPAPSGRRHAGDSRVRELPTSGGGASRGDRIERPVRASNGEHGPPPVRVDRRPRRGDDARYDRGWPFSVVDQLRDLRYESSRRGLVRGVPAWLYGQAARYREVSDAVRPPDARRGHRSGDAWVVPVALFAFYVRLLVLAAVVLVVLFAPLYPLAGVLPVPGGGVGGAWVAVPGLGFAHWLRGGPTDRPPGTAADSARCPRTDPGTTTPGVSGSDRRGA